MITKRKHERIIKSGKADVTSLTDIALSLVIFFIVTLPAFFESGIFVKAPAAKTVRGKKNPGTEFKVFIYLKNDGTTVLNDKVYAKGDSVGLLIEELLKRSPSKLAIIRADGGVDHVEVVKMMDLVKQKGAIRIALLRGAQYKESP